MPVKIRDVYALNDDAVTSRDEAESPIGVALVQQDGSLCVKLNAFPLSGKIHIQGAKRSKRPLKKQKRRTS